MKTPQLISATQCRVARCLLDWSQDDLSARSKVSLKSIADFERGAASPYGRTLFKLWRAFDRAAIRFSHDKVNIRLEPSRRRA